jgi:hypothetical protein
MRTIGHVRTFAPEQWGEVDYFSKLHVNSFPSLSRSERKAVAGVGNHFGKALLLLNLATKLRPNLNLDTQQLQEQGFTPGANARELSAVIEAVFTELYSSIDCARQVVVATHHVKDSRGMPRKSTRKLFSAVRNREMDGILSPSLIEAFVLADWYPELLRIRDELTHQNTGDCHLDEKTRDVRYVHGGLGDHTKALVIDNVFSELEKYISGVNLFLGIVFRYLNTRLKPDPVFQMCGIFSGRAYTREVSPVGKLDVNSGWCTSYKWFELEENLTCILADTCGAYKRAKEQDT